jgi:hypothetical protein
MSEAIPRLGAARLAFARCCGYLRSADWKTNPHIGGALASLAIDIAMTLGPTEHADCACTR